MAGHAGRTLRSPSPQARRDVSDCVNLLTFEVNATRSMQAIFMRDYRSNRNPTGRKTMIRTLAIFAFGIASLVGQPAFADLIPGSQSKVANWVIGAYDSNGRFSHCAMSTLYVSGI